jgi:hypothetical protein
MVLHKVAKPKTDMFSFREVGTYVSDEIPRVYVRDGKVVVFVEDIIVVFCRHETLVSEIADMLNEAYLCLGEDGHRDE